jgi:hypothetical protein
MAHARSVNAELICHFFSETRCPLFSGLVCHLFASSVPIIRKAVWFEPRSGPFMRWRRAVPAVMVNHGVSLGLV